MELHRVIIELYLLIGLCSPVLYKENELTMNYLIKEVQMKGKCKIIKVCTKEYSNSTTDR